MKCSLFLPLLLLLASFPAFASVYEEVTDDPRRSGGIYYAYPVESDTAPSPPEGYEPVFISHYGRHGSRWAIKEWKYTMVLNIFAAQRRNGNLTPAGERVEKMVQSLWDDAQGNAGALTPLGERQHKAIASRLADRYPALFADSMAVRAYSSSEPRCIVSMAAFCERLKEMKPSLEIIRTVSPGNMDFIAYSTPEAKALGSDTASWRPRFNEWCDTLLHPARIMSELFVNPSEVDDHSQLMWLLHDIAVAEQNTTVRTGILGIFTPGERFALWRRLNGEMYIKHANATLSGGIGPRSAVSLLKHIIDDADRQLASNHPGVTLRFGHDTNLIRLLALMQVEECADSESSLEKFHLAWQDYRVSPMGANLQLIFFRNTAGHTLVLLRHNERPAALPLSPHPGTTHLYPWAALRAYLLSRLNNPDNEPPNRVVKYSRIGQ